MSELHKKPKYKLSLIKKANLSQLKKFIYMIIIRRYHNNETSKY